jgi:hypothetical protein
MPEPGVQFSCEQLRDEVDVLEEIGDDFLAAGYREVLGNFREQVGALIGARGLGSLAIDRRWPVTTLPCNGGYERREGGAQRELYATVSCLWQVLPLGSPRKKAQADRLVAVAGTASTVVSLLRPSEDGAELVASWRMEIGNPDSPGAHFHVQIPRSQIGDEDAGILEEPPWPHWLPVPRFPAPPTTPIAAVEFVLAEIFQDRWAQMAGSDHRSLPRWNRIHLSRYQAFLAWQRRVLERDTAATPLLALKGALPDADMFTSDGAWKPKDRRALP